MRQPQSSSSCVLTSAVFCIEHKPTRAQDTSQWSSLSPSLLPSLPPSQCAGVDTEHAGVLPSQDHSIPLPTLTPSHPHLPNLTPSLLAHAWLALVAPATAGGLPHCSLHSRLPASNHQLPPPQTVSPRDHTPSHSPPSHPHSFTPSRLTLSPSHALLCTRHYSLLFLSPSSTPSSHTSSVSEVDRGYVSADSSPTHNFTMVYMSVSLSL